MKRWWLVLGSVTLSVTALVVVLSMVQGAEPGEPPDLEGWWLFNGRCTRTLVDGSREVRRIQGAFQIMQENGDVEIYFEPYDALFEGALSARFVTASLEEQGWALAPGDGNGGEEGPPDAAIFDARIIGRGRRLAGVVQGNCHGIESGYFESIRFRASRAPGPE